MSEIRKNTQKVVSKLKQYNSRLYTKISKGSQEPYRSVRIKMTTLCKPCDSFQMVSQYCTVCVS